MVFVPAVFFCRDEFLPSLLSFFLSRVVIVVVVWRRSSSPRSLACSLVHSRALPFFLPSVLLPLCVWFFLVASTHSSLSSVLSVVRLFDALVRFLGFCCRFPAPLSAQTRSTYATLVFIFYNNGILLGFSPLVCFSLSLVFAPAFLSFSCSCCKRK